MASNFLFMTFDEIKTISIERTEEQEIREIQKSLQRQKLKLSLSSQTPESSDQMTTVTLNASHLATAMIEVCDICRKDNYLYALDANSKIMISLDVKIASIISLISTKYNENSLFQASRIQGLISDVASLLYSRVLEFRNAVDAPSTLVLTRMYQVLDFKNKSISDDLSILKKYDFFYKSPRSLVDDNQLSIDQRGKFLLYSKILDQVLNDWSNGQTDELKFLLQMSYAIICGFNCQKAIFLMGSGGNGKSTFLEMNSYLVGSESTVPINIHQYGDSNSINLINASTRFLCGDDFSKRGLTGDYLISNFKSLTAGNVISVNKKYQDNVRISTTALLLQATNHDPDFFEFTEAIKSRVIMHQWCSKSFRGKETSLEEIGEFFELKKLILDEEFMDLYFTRVFNEVDYFSQFDIPKSSVDLSDSVLKEADVYGHYLSEIKESVGDCGIIPNKLNFELFKQWAKQNAPHLLNVKINTFTKELKRRASEYDYEFISDQARYDAKKYDKIQAICSKYRVDKSILSTSQYAIRFKNEISEEELNNFDVSKQELSPREIQMVMILAYSRGRADISALFNHYL